jgi:23S rRNA (uracil1939-C5)-methyltransferase
LSGEQRAKITVMPGPAGAGHDAAAAAQVVIVDPPRKGLDAELRESLSRTPPQRLIYVSCGLQSFQEDAAALTGAGGMRLTALQAFNLMPYTEHVETLAVFERSTMTHA